MTKVISTSVFPYSEAWVVPNLGYIVKVRESENWKVIECAKGEKNKKPRRATINDLGMIKEIGSYRIFKEGDEYVFCSRS
jgi:hypothetical protein